MKFNTQIFVFLFLATVAIEVQCAPQSALQFLGSSKCSHKFLMIFSFIRCCRMLFSQDPGYSGNGYLNANTGAGRFQSSDLITHNNQICYFLLQHHQETLHSHARKIWVFACRGAIRPSESSAAIAQKICIVAFSQGNLITVKSCCKVDMEFDEKF